MDEEKIHLLDDDDVGGRTSKTYGSSPNEKYDAHSKNRTSPTQLSSISPTIDTSSRRRSSIAAMAAAAESKYFYMTHILFTSYAQNLYSHNIALTLDIISTIATKEYSR